MMAGLPELVLDGTSFGDLDGFFAAITRDLGLTAWWGRNLDALNDILRGGFGTPDGGFTLRWDHSDVSAQLLGWPATLKFLEENLTTCHPSNIPRVEAELRAARRGEGQTLFAKILHIIAVHGPGGREAEDNVHLILA